MSVKRFQLSLLEDLELGMRRTAFLDLSDVYVPGEGSDDPIAMIVGEAPGAQEEIQGRPFVGQAGIVLRQLMDMARLWATVADSDPNAGSPVNCWLTNVVKFRPPRNRTPTQEEITTFRYYLRKEWLAIGQPSVIIPVGSVALQAVWGGRPSILRVAGELRIKVSKHTGKRLFYWPMIHPSFVLRSSSTQLQESVEKDWVKLGHWLHKETTSPIGLVYDPNRG